MTKFTDNAGRRIAEGMTVRVEQQIRIVMKPKPFWATEGMWIWIASRFVRVEKLLPTFTLKDKP